MLKKVIVIFLINVFTPFCELFENVLIYLSDLCVKCTGKLWFLGLNKSKFMTLNIKTRMF